MGLIISKLPSGGGSSSSGGSGKYIIPAVTKSETTTSYAFNDLEPGTLIYFSATPTITGATEDVDYEIESDRIRIINACSIVVTI